MDFNKAHRALLALANPEKASFFRGFFKTGKGQYGEGDRFLGITVPAIRKLGRAFRQLSLPDLERLLISPYNEERLLALIILAERYKRGDSAEQKRVFRTYIRHRRHINNWNLVDVSAPAILGSHLLCRKRALLYRLARSRNIWDRRIAILASFTFIRADDFLDTLRLTESLLRDKHDLIHKACGWMLREIGKRDQRVLETFLQKYHRVMPRTMLRYAIERFPPATRKAYLSQA